MIPSSWIDYLDLPKEIDVDSLRAELNSAFVACFQETEYDQITRKCDRKTVQALFAGVLSAKFGSWVQGWQSFPTSGGGVIQNWCCAQHSVFAGGDRSLNDTIERVANSVVEWFEFLKFLHQKFEALDEESKEDDIAVKTEKAAVFFVHKVIDLNNASDAWYATFEMILKWYLEVIGVETELINDQIEAAVEGHFSSWMEPKQETLKKGVAAIGAVVKNPAPELHREVPDTTSSWIRFRDREWFDRTPFVPIVDVKQDRHLKFVQEFDFEKSAERGEAMVAALAKCRSDASSGKLLDWELLKTWQALVLGQPSEAIEFRSGDAFAKEGRERYPLFEKTPKQFKKLLLQANETDTCPIQVASRAYLDVCFFHPFEDGNARAARLTLEYVLALHDFALILTDPIFRFARSAGDYHFLGTLRCVVGKRQF